MEYWESHTMDEFEWMVYVLLLSNFFIIFFIYLLFLPSGFKNTLKCKSDNDLIYLFCKILQSEVKPFSFFFLNFFLMEGVFNL